jgi:hypothetical protein
MPEAVHSVLIIAGFVGMGVALVSGRALTDKPQLGRRLYWGGWGAGVLLFALGMAAPWPNILAAVAIFAVMAVAFAYFLTPYLTVDGRTYTAQERFRSGE